MVLRLPTPSGPDATPLEIVTQPFDKIALEVISPLPKSVAGYQFILIIVNYTTCYPDAIPMKVATAPKVAEELIQWIMQVGIPREILSDQDTNFMLRILKGVCMTFKIRHLRMLVYHSQTDRLIEHFNQILKATIRNCIQGDTRR